MFAVKFSLQLLFLFPLFLCMVVHGKKKQKLTEIHVIRDWSKSIGEGGGGGPEHLEMWLIKNT